MRKILATSLHPGGVNAIIPVIKELREERKVDVTVVGTEYAEATFKQNGIAYTPLSAYGIEDASEESMERLLAKEFPDLVLTGSSAQDETHPDVIEQTLTRAARKWNFPTLTVLDSWTNYTTRFSDILRGKDFAFLPDKIAIMDEYARQEMITDGFDPASLVVTGNPHFDGLERKRLSFPQERRMQLRNNLAALDDVLVFYGATNALKDEKESYGYWDLDNIKIIKDALLDVHDKHDVRANVRAKGVVRLHPRLDAQGAHEIREYIASLPAGLLTISAEPAHDLILSCDLSVVSASTLGIEAVYLRKPCISLQPNLKRADDISVLTKNGLMPVAYTPAECKSLLEYALGDASARTQIVEKGLPFTNDGKATQRVTQLVYDMLR